MVVLSGSDIIREALVKKWTDFAGRPHSFTGDIVSGGGCSISLGDYSDEWKLHRRLVHSALQRCTAESLHSLIQQQALKLRKVLLEYNETAVDLSEDFTVAASNVITTLAFGKQYNKTSPELQCLHGCLNEIVALWGSSWISALDSFPILRVEDDAIKERGALTAFLKKQEKTEGESQRSTLTDTHVHMTTVDLLIGGTETTAAWLSWTVAFLLHRPEIQHKVHEEMCSVLEARYPDYKDRHRLPHLSALISEVLRLRPVAPLAVPHRAIRNSSIAGYFIPKDTVIIPNLFGAHHDPTVWRDPYSFKPERFLKADGALLRSLLPFSGGARLCLGESVAKMEIFLFTAYLLRDFELLHPGDKECLPDLKGVASVVLKTKPFKVIVRPRA
ncbi:hypothetical protein AALO_G00185260 [Alosa alosa]|uniref:Steroid 21-hydroxylase n=1 Tax=Alosa alosa TaxID=278164 RepID=A0AAV6G9T5_9TELE|nr:hypothetical protein AALO_G00185260 [Alosa alosa]